MWRTYQNLSSTPWNLHPESPVQAHLATVPRVTVGSRSINTVPLRSKSQNQLLVRTWSRFTKSRSKLRKSIRSVNASSKPSTMRHIYKSRLRIVKGSRMRSWLHGWKSYNKRLHWMTRSRQFRNCERERTWRGRYMRRNLLRLSSRRNEKRKTNKE